MGNLPPGAMGGDAPGGNDQNDEEDKKKKAAKKKRFEPRPMRQGRRRRRKGPTGMSKTPTIVPTSKCKLRMLKLDRVKDFLLLEQEFIANFEGTSDAVGLRRREERGSWE
jgi:26S proteasome regulatory subunit T2